MKVTIDPAKVRHIIVERSCLENREETIRLARRLVRIANMLWPVIKPPTSPLLPPILPETEE